MDFMHTHYTEDGADDYASVYIPIGGNRALPANESTEDAEPQIHNTPADDTLTPELRALDDVLGWLRDDEANRMVIEMYARGCRVYRAMSREIHKQANVNKDHAAIEMIEAYQAAREAPTFPNMKRVAAAVNAWELAHFGKRAG